MTVTFDRQECTYEMIERIAKFDPIVERALKTPGASLEQKLMAMVYHMAHRHVHMNNKLISALMRCPSYIFTDEDDEG